MSENAVKKENWGSRIGYILSTLGMSIGVGAMWRFPMLTAKYGGGTFVLAFIIISIVAVIPAGWAESALGRKYKRSTAGNLEAVAGKKGKAFGTFMAAIPMCLAFYYPVVMAICAVYMGSTIGGAPFLNDVEGYYNQINANRPLIYAIVLAVIILTALISLGGIKKGVEKCCKILLPALFVVLLVVDIRVFTLDGIRDTDVLHVIGNHEADDSGNGAVAVKSTFGIPADWYSVERGDVYIAVLNHTSDKDSLQRFADWLVEDAAKSTCTWKVRLAVAP